MTIRSELTHKEQKALKPFGNLFFQIDQMVAGLSDDDLTLLKRACDKVTETNCWCCSFAAAQYLPREIAIQTYQRSVNAQRAERTDASN